MNENNEKYDEQASVAIFERCFLLAFSAAINSVILVHCIGVVFIK